MHDIMISLHDTGIMVNDHLEKIKRLLSSPYPREIYNARTPEERHTARNKHLAFVKY